MSRDVLEEPDLVVLRLEAEDRVEAEEDQWERPAVVDLGEVADRDGDLAAAGLVAQSRDHLLRDVDAVDVDTALGERQ